MSRPRDNEQLRDVFITTRWTKDETATIDKALRPGETRSQYLRRLVERDTSPRTGVVTDGAGRVIQTFVIPERNRHE